MSEDKKEEDSISRFYESRRKDRELELKELRIKCVFIVSIVFLVLAGLAVFIALDERVPR